MLQIPGVFFFYICAYLSANAVANTWCIIFLGWVYYDCTSPDGSNSVNCRYDDFDSNTIDFRVTEIVCCIKRYDDSSIDCPLSNECWGGYRGETPVKAYIYPGAVATTWRPSRKNRGNGGGIGELR